MPPVRSRLNKWRCPIDKDDDEISKTPLLDTTTNSDTRGTRDETLSKTRLSDAKVNDTEHFLSTSFQNLSINDTDAESPIQLSTKKRPVFDSAGGGKNELADADSKESSLGRPNYKKVILNDLAFNFEESYVPMRRPNCKKEMEDELADSKESSLGRPKYKKVILNELADTQESGSPNIPFNFKESYVPMRRPNCKKEMEDDLTDSKDSSLDRINFKKVILNDLAFNFEESYVPLRRPNCKIEMEDDPADSKESSLGRTNYKKVILNELADTQESGLLGPNVAFTLEKSYVPMRRPNCKKEVEDKLADSKQSSLGRPNYEKVILNDLADTKESGLRGPNVAFNFEESYVPLRRPNLKTDIQAKLSATNESTLRPPISKKAVLEELAATMATLESLKRSYETSLIELATYKKEAQQKEQVGRNQMESATMKPVQTQINATQPQIDENNNQDVLMPTSACICDAPSQRIICKTCKKLIFGRIVERCPIHKNHVFLMDIFACPGCASPKECLAYLTN